MPDDVKTLTIDRPWKAGVTRTLLLTKEYQHGSASRGASKTDSSGSDSSGGLFDESLTTQISLTVDKIADGQIHFVWDSELPTWRSSHPQIHGLMMQHQQEFERLTVPLRYHLYSDPADTPKQLYEKGFLDNLGEVRQSMYDTYALAAEYTQKEYDKADPEQRESLPDPRRLQLSADLALDTEKGLIVPDIADTPLQYHQFETSTFEADPNTPSGFQVISPIPSVTFSVKDRQAPDGCVVLEYTLELEREQGEYINNRTVHYDYGTGFFHSVVVTERRASELEEPLVTVVTLTDVTDE